MRRRHYQGITLAIAVAAGIAVWIIGTRVFPHLSINHDEGVYLQQAAMLLEGRLRLHPPMSEVFRPWFFVDGESGLYPKYTPPTAILFAIGDLLGRYRLALVGIAVANVSLLTGVVAEVWDRRTGLVAALFLLGSPLFLIDSSVFLSYAPTTMFNLAFAYGYLRADRTSDRRWAGFAGLAIGIAFFARPYTAVLFATPFVGHSLWVISRQPRTVPVKFWTAVGGSVGILLALGYNAVMTGNPLRFPYQVFGPRDGIGFGTRALLAHEIQYTPELALRANRIAVELFLTEWIAGGIAGAVLALVGLVGWITRRDNWRAAPLAGLFVAIPVGNLYFWGTLNIVGDLARPGDGLVSFLGPYYHFDLLVPTAAFAGVGTTVVATRIHQILANHLDHRRAAAVFALVVVVAAMPAAVVTAGTLDSRLDRNRAVTNVYDRTYSTVNDAVEAPGLVLLPTPYGEWLNHPFQALRNDPGYDGPILFALNDRPIATAEQFQGRNLYRLVYRGPWAPAANSPEAVRLQPIQLVEADRIAFRTTLGIPDGAGDVSVRLGSEAGSVYAVLENPSERVDVRVLMTEDRATLLGPDGERQSVPLTGQNRLTLTAYVDYAGSGGFTYRFDVPVDTQNGSVTALTPTIERCVRANTCGGGAAYIPDEAPEGVYVETELRGREDS